MRARPKGNGCALICQEQWRPMAIQHALLIELDQEIAGGQYLGALLLSIQRKKGR
jgi:hypothetical protein